MANESTSPQSKPNGKPSTPHQTTVNRDESDRFFNLVSCYSSSLLITYAEEQNIAMDKLLEGIDTPLEKLQNSLEWIDAHVWSRLARNLEASLEEEELTLREIGHQIVLRNVSEYQYLTIRLAPVRVIMNFMTTHMEETINRNLRISMKYLSSNEMRITFTPHLPSAATPEICEYNKGAVLALFHMKGYKEAILLEDACINNGDPECIWRIRWSRRKSFIGRFIKYISYTFLSRIIHKKCHRIKYDIVNNRVKYSFHNNCPLTPCIPLSPIDGGKGEMCRVMLLRRKNIECHADARFLAPACGGKKSRRSVSDG